MTDIKKTIVTPVGLVKFYALDQISQKSGKFSLVLTLDLASKEAKDFQKVVGDNASVQEKVIDGKPVLQIGASTKFDSFIVANDKGEKIAPISNVRVNLGDVMMAQMRVSIYEYNFQGKKGAALNLNEVKIISHDTTNREEVADTGNKSVFLEALATETDKLAALKG